MAMQGVGAAGASGLMGMGLPPAGGLTPEGLMLYLKTRLEGLDTQINTIFTKQQKNQKIQETLQDIQKQLSQLDNNTGDRALKGKSDYASDKARTYTKAGYEARINADIAAIKELDPSLGAKMRADLRTEGQILFVEDGLYKTAEVKASTQYVDNLTKDLNAGSQMDMIHLQSIMSSRQTAVQLSTNLIQSLSRSAAAIVANTGK